MLNGKPVVLLDVDDVVCRCIGRMASEAGKKLGLEIHDTDVKTWDFHDTFDSPGLKEHVEGKMSEKGWCASLEVFPGAVAGVKSLMEISEVFFVTAPFHGEHWMHERRQWLYDNFGIDRKRVLQGHSKFLVRGELFVDDKIENLQKWEAYGKEIGVPGMGVIWDRPHNQQHPGAGAFFRVWTWGQLNAVVRMVWEK
jgi:5'(3')-deoxyribonucleotidase